MTKRKMSRKQKYDRKVAVIGVVALWIGIALLMFIVINPYQVGV